MEDFNDYDDEQFDYILMHIPLFYGFYDKCLLDRSSRFYRTIDKELDNSDSQG